MESTDRAGAIIRRLVLWIVLLALVGAGGFYLFREFGGKILTHADAPARGDSSARATPVAAAPAITDDINVAHPTGAAVGRSLDG